MKEFCDVEEIRKLDAFKEKGVSKTTKITHVSAHFNSFAACELSRCFIQRSSR